MGSSTTEKFALELCMMNWGDNSVLKDLKEEIIDNIRGEQDNLTEVPHDLVPFLLKEHDRKVKVANTLIKLINEFLEEDNN